MICFEYSANEHEELSQVCVDPLAGANYQCRLFSYPPCLVTINIQFYVVDPLSWVSVWQFVR
jgi:hypothetical protein